MTRDLVPLVRHREQPKILLMLVLIAAAMPVRFHVSLPGANSLSVLEVVLWAAAVTLVVDCAHRPLDVGYQPLFALLCVPVIVTGMSLLWTQDPAATFHSTVVYLEGVIAYLVVVRELAGVSAERAMTYVKRYGYLLIVPAVLLLLRVPGFAPEEAEAVPGSARYLSYYTRLSHPMLGPSNNLADVLACFVPILLYWGHTRHDSKFTRAGYVLLVAVACTLSRGTVLALLAVAALAGLGYMVRRRRAGDRMPGKILVSAGLSLAAVVLLYLVNPATREFFSSRFSSDNVFLREELFADAADKIADRPILGYGAGTPPDGNVSLAHVHNTFLQQAVSFGLLLGLVVVLALLGTAVFFFSRWRTSDVARVVGFTLLAQMLSFTVESSYEGTVLRVLFYLSVGLLTAVVRAGEAQPVDVLPSSPEGRRVPSSVSWGRTTT